MRVPVERQAVVSAPKNQRGIGCTASRHDGIDEALGRATASRVCLSHEAQELKVRAGLLPLIGRVNSKSNTDMNSGGAVRRPSPAPSSVCAVKTDKPPYRVPSMAEIAAVPDNGLRVVSTSAAAAGHASGIGWRATGSCGRASSSRRRRRRIGPTTRIRSWTRGTSGRSSPKRSWRRSA